MLTPNRKPPAVISLEEAIQDPSILEPPQSISPWLAWRGRLSFFWGREKDGKSTIAAWDAIAASLRGHKVLWLGFDENPTQWVERFEDIKDKDRSKIVWPAMEARPQTMRDIRDLLAYHSPDIVYVDTLTAACTSLGLAVPETSESEKWFDLVKQWKDLTEGFPEKGIVLLGHAKKDNTDYSGSHGKVAAADMGIQLRPSVRKKPGKLIYRGRWHVDPKHFIWDEDIGLIPQVDKVSGLEEVLYKQVQRLKKCTRNELCKKVKKRRSVVWRTISKMLHDTTLAEDGRHLVVGPAKFQGVPKSGNTTAP